jgi:phosphoribosylanthranilate isomerase
MNTKVKICGIRSVESALAAIAAGADFIGLNFVPTSKRKITEQTAREIIAAVRGQVKVVGVFQDTESSFINQQTSILGLDFVQLHGHEDPAYCAQVQAPVIKAVSLQQDGDASAVMKTMQSFDVPFFLLDRQEQGEGSLVRGETAHQIAGEFEIFLAGGLTPENITEIVREVRPFAVDVAGGIETDGKEDVEKMRRFINNAKGI